MGMTIETAIRNLSMYDVNECGNAELHTWYKDIDKDMKDSLNVAISIMYKYQKIEEIYKNWCYPTYFNANDAMNKLGEVLKDGHVD